MGKRIGKTAAKVIAKANSKKAGRLPEMATPAAPKLTREERLKAHIDAANAKLAKAQERAARAAEAAQRAVDKAQARAAKLAEKEAARAAKKRERLENGGEKVQGYVPKRIAVALKVLYPGQSQGAALRDALGYWLSNLSAQNHETIDDAMAPAGETVEA